MNTLSILILHQLKTPYVNITDSALAECSRTARLKTMRRNRGGTGCRQYGVVKINQWRKSLCASKADRP